LIIDAAVSAAGTPQHLPLCASYPESLVKDVIPFMEKTCRAIANKDNQAIAGLSTGGGHTGCTSILFRQWKTRRL
jgi:enterochelin esterase-like enzyme